MEYYDDEPRGSLKADGGVVRDRDKRICELHRNRACVLTVLPESVIQIDRQVETAPRRRRRTCTRERVGMIPVT